VGEREAQIHCAIDSVGYLGKAMVIYAIQNGKIIIVEPTSFQGQGMLERRDI
jgi:hypothetical protein